MMKMKDSDVEWIGKIPETWSLGTISRLFKQRNEKVSDYDFEPLSVTKGGIVPQLESAAKSNDHSNRKLVKSGDFVINSRSDRKMSSGVSSYEGSVSLINLVMIPDSHSLDTSYVNYLMKNYGFAEEFYRWGTGIVADLWSTNWERGKKIQIPVPNLEEQQAIAYFLDEKVAKIDEIIADTKLSIEELKAYKQSLITEAVTKGLESNAKMKDSGIEWIGEVPEGWSINKIKYISTLRNEKAEYKNGEKFLVLEKMKSFTPGYISLDSIVDEGSQMMIQKGDVLFSKLRPYLGKVALADFDGFATGELLAYKNVKINPKFFMYKFISDQILQPVNASMYGTKMPRANADFINSLPISYPSNEEQAEIVKVLEVKLSEIGGLISEKESLISKYEDYKKSMIYEYVTGKKQVM